MKETGYLLQATLILLWWIGLSTSQEFYVAFQFPDIPKQAFNSFMLPDLIIIALLSILRAYKKENKLDYIILGAFGYATLYCINASILTKGGMLPTTTMALGLFWNLFLVNEKQLFRTSNTNSLLSNTIKTIFQIICIWFITLFAIPVLIINSFGLSVESSNHIKLISIVLFIIASSLGLYSAYNIVKMGEGTPLPLDQSQNLVTTGAYKYVRNPMAIAGIMQGISISIFFLSIHIFVYTIIGLIVWQFVVRPIEEKDMTNRFGNDYIEYKQRVKCWIPNFTKS